MTSQISICNLALSNIGKDNIADINEGTAEARACRQFYDQTRMTLLEAYPWRFAQVTDALAEVTANPLPAKWAYAYQAPATSRKIMRIDDAYFVGFVADHLGGSLGEIPYDLAGSYLYCNISPAFCTYIDDVTDVSRYPALFVEALSWHLATRLCMPLTKDPKMRADTYQLARVTQSAAEVADANQQRTTATYEPAMLTARA